MDQILEGVSYLVRNNSHLILACVAGYSLYQSECRLSAQKVKIKSHESRIISLEQELEEERIAKRAIQDRVVELQNAMSLDCRQLINQLEFVIKEAQISKQFDVGSFVRPEANESSSWIPLMNDSLNVTNYSHSMDDDSTDESGCKDDHYKLDRTHPSFRAESALLSLSSVINQRTFQPKDRAKYILLCLLNAYEVYLDEEMFMDDTLAVTPLTTEMVAHLKEKIAEDFDIDDTIEKVMAEKGDNRDSKEEDEEDDDNDDDESGSRALKTKQSELEITDN